MAFWSSQASANRKRVENIAKKRLDSLLKESRIRDCEDPNDFAVSSLGTLGRRMPKMDSKVGGGSRGEEGSVLCSPGRPLPPVHRSCSHNTNQHTRT